MIYKQLKAQDLEKCVSCHCITGVPKYKHIERRHCYIYGVGQLCERCYKKIYLNVNK